MCWRGRERQARRGENCREKGWTGLDRTGRLGQGRIVAGRRGRERQVWTGQLSTGLERAGEEWTGRRGRDREVGVSWGAECRREAWSGRQGAVWRVVHRSGA